MTWATIGEVAGAAAGFAGVFYPLIGRMMTRFERRREERETAAETARAAAMGLAINTAVAAAKLEVSGQITAAIDPIATSVAGLTERVDSATAQLDRIEVQFGPNGGGLRETVNRIDSTLATSAADVASFGAAHEGLKERFADHLDNALADRQRLDQRLERIDQVLAEAFGPISPKAT